MQFNNNEFKKFREAIKEAVKGVEKEFGVEVNFGNISYNESSFTIKTEVLNGGVEEARKKSYLENCEMWGLKKDYFGKEFLCEGLKAKVIGLEMTRRKYPVLVENEKGKVFLMTVSGIKKCIEGTK